MNPAVDQFGKVTVSLGGRCPLGCLHCYVNASAFSADRKRSVAQTMDLLHSLPTPFQVVCLSGDIDCFLRPQLARELLERVAIDFPTVDILYTTRLVPPAEVVEALQQLGADLADRGRLLIGCVSFISSSFPNRMENEDHIATTDDRIDFLGDLARGRQPTIAALRPTFPFSLVSRRDVSELIARCAQHAAALLGETFILDGAGEIAAKVGMPARVGTDEISHLSFLHQTSLWRKRSLPEETSYASLVARAHNRPYFLRSISALAFFRSYWDLSTGVSRYRYGDYLDTSAECVSP